MTVTGSLAAITFMDGVAATMMTVLMCTGLLMIFIVLLQRGRGGGLAGAFGGMGGQSAFGTKAGDVFTKITVGIAIAWVVLAAVSGLVVRAATNTSLGGDDGFKDDTEQSIGAADEDGEDSGASGGGADAAPPVEPVTPDETDEGDDEPEPGESGKRSATPQDPSQDEEPTKGPATDPLGSQPPEGGTTDPEGGSPEPKSNPEPDDGTTDSPTPEPGGDGEATPSE